MNLYLFIVVVGLWTIEALRLLLCRPVVRKKRVNKVTHKRHVRTWRYVDGVAREEVCGWTVE